MGTDSQTHREKTKVTFECSVEEKTYIKMLAVKAHMTLGEFVLSYLKADFPSQKKRTTKDKKAKSNKETVKAMKELREGGGTVYESIDDFWTDMGVKPRA